MIALVAVPVNIVQAVIATIIVQAPIPTVVVLLVRIVILQEPEVAELVTVV